MRPVTDLTENKILRSATYMATVTWAESHGMKLALTKATDYMGTFEYISFDTDENGDAVFVYNRVDLDTDAIYEDDIQGELEVSVTTIDPARIKSIDAIRANNPEDVWSAEKVSRLIAELMPRLIECTDIEWHDRIRINMIRMCTLTDLNTFIMQIRPLDFNIDWQAHIPCVMLTTIREGD